MSLFFLTRSLSERLQRSVRPIVFWRRKHIKPLTFAERDRQRDTAGKEGGRSTLCSCPACRHARLTECE